ncbi:MAG: phosphoenolpyruvate carboxylase [Planctomycetota bacterium]
MSHPEAPLDATPEGGVFFEPKDLPLRRDVGWLGQLLGRLLQELGDEELFPAVEGARLLARRRRRGSEEAEAQLIERLDGLDDGMSHEVVRAFSAYFGLVNMAERVHRIRRRVDRLRRGEPQPGGVRAVLKALAAAGVEAEEVEEALDGLLVEPVFTAHPTEAVRRTILRKEQRIARVLVERFHQGTMTPEEIATARQQVELDIATAWQTDEQLRDKPTVGEELERARARMGALEALAERAEDREVDAAKLDAEAVEAGLLDPRQVADVRKRKAPAPRKPYRSFVGTHGSEIRVGRTSKDNDTLTIRLARGSDYWLHTADCPGSHVVLCTPKGKEPDHEEVLDAAHLAIHFSPIRGTDRAPVHVAQRKHIHKPKGAKPGLVALSGGRILEVRMQQERLDALLRRAHEPPNPS